MTGRHSPGHSVQGVPMERRILYPQGVPLEHGVDGAGLLPTRCSAGTQGRGLEEQKLSASALLSVLKSDDLNGMNSVDNLQKITPKDELVTVKGKNNQFSGKGLFIK